MTCPGSQWDYLVRSSMIKGGGIKVEKGMAKQKQLVVTILAMALVALLLVTICAPAPPVAGETVVVGAVWGMTGPATSSLQIQTGAIQDYFRYFNYKLGDHRGVTKVAIYEVRDGKIGPVSDWRDVPVLPWWEYTK